jgi:flagellar export protein FliJ
MKKFKFKLQPLVKYKETIERMQKEELKRAQQTLQELQNEENSLLDAYADNERSLREALDKNENVVQALSEHDFYFRYLRDALIEVRDRIVKAEEVVVRCQERLIVTMKELKTYEKLRREQYEAYLSEAKAETEKEMDDLVSFKIVSDN